MASNLNDTTPAAPGQFKNVKWQNDGSGNSSAYVNNELALIDALAQTADIALATLFAVTAAAMYRVSVSIIVTQAATTSSTLPKVTIKWTDADNNTVQSVDVTPTNSGNTLTTVQTGSLVLNAKAATNIQYQTSGTASVGATPLNYALHIRVEPI